MKQNQPFRKMMYSWLISLALLFWAQVAASDTQAKPDRAEERLFQIYAQKELEKLCREPNPLPASIQKELKCRYTDNGDPFLKLAPFKEEDAFLKPRIVLFHDVIFAKEIEILKKLAQPLIKSADVGDSERTVKGYRTSQVAWIDEDKHEILKFLNRRVAHMTRLSITTAEELQVAYYGNGSMYLHHFDFAPHNIPSPFKGGNRIASLIFYLNDVEEGGKTVFTKLKVFLTPRKGSAVFWFNLTPNGIGDPLTLHAACPVISGEKWVSNLWLHEDGQEFLRPCTLENQPAVDWKRVSLVD